MDLRRLRGGWSGGFSSYRAAQSGALIAKPAARCDRLFDSDFNPAFSDQRAPRSCRLGTATSRAVPTGRHRRWRCGMARSPGLARDPRFGPYDAPQPWRPGPPRQRARPNRELSGLSFASYISLVQAFRYGAGASRMSSPCSPHNDPPRGLLRPRQSRSGEQVSWSKNFSAKYSAGAWL